MPKEAKILINLFKNSNNINNNKSDTVTITLLNVIGNVNAVRFGELDFDTPTAR